jgi:hypothetical protein
MKGKELFNKSLLDNVIQTSCLGLSCSSRYAHYLLLVNEFLREEKSDLLIEHLKVLARKRDVPYQTLLKIFLIEKVEQEMVIKKSA